MKRIKIQIITFTFIATMMLAGIACTPKETKDESALNVSTQSEVDTEMVETESGKEVSSSEEDAETTLESLETMETLEEETIEVEDGEATVGM